MNDLKDIEFDQLTGQYSRWRLHLDLKQIIDAGLNRVVISLDVDNFKQINAKYGTAAGDRLLKDVAKALGEVYVHSAVYHESGDVFVVILAPTTYSRYHMSRMTHQLFEGLHRLHVIGHEDQALTFSIGSVFIDPAHHTSPDIVRLEARSARLEAKKHGGNYLYSNYGCIPDVEGLFTLLLDSRNRYNSTNNRLFSIYNESDWLAYLNEGAMLRHEMFHNNQAQLDDILNYYRAGDLPDYDYEKLFWLVMESARWLDAFMIEMLIGGILLPYYEQCDRDVLRVRSRLGHLYLLLADSLMAVWRMGDLSQQGRITTLLDKCLDVCRDLPHNSVEFEPYFFALCEKVGHFESLTQQLADVEECDRCYSQLRELLLGDDPIVFRQPGVVEYFESLLNNARLYPLYRACYLRINRLRLTDAERQEYDRRLCYIREHLADGVFDMAADNNEYRNMARYLQGILLDELTATQILQRLQKGLHAVHELEYGTLSQSNLIIVAYLFLAASQAVITCSLPAAEKRQIGISGVIFLNELLRKRESVATDNQLLFIVQVLIRAMVSSPVITPADKLFFLERSMASLMLDTYCHSKAVAAYAKVILTNIIDRYPSLLVGEGRPYSSLDEVAANRESLLEFMDYACLLHDVGKMRLTPITSNSYRRLSQPEFDLIRTHPAAGISILSLEPAFNAFHPFVYGHHRWWNGEAGYPDGGQEMASHSSVQVLVDILTLCDSLEAATSHIGRNYRQAKTFVQIFDEFLSESGTRYSSEVLQTIIGTPEAYHNIRQMVDYRWKEVYQAIFQQMVKVKDHVVVPSFEAVVPSLYGCKPRGGADADPDAALPVPEWLSQMNHDQLMLFAFSHVERTRMSVMQNDIMSFYYDAASDRIELLSRDANGRAVYHYGNHFCEKPMGLFLSEASYRRVVDMILRVINDPDCPKEGQVKLEDIDKNRSVLATYTSVLDCSRRVRTIVGHVEDSATSRSRLLQTIQRQNLYLEMFDALAEQYMTVVFTDISLTHFDLIKGIPGLVNALPSFPTTRHIIDYTRDKLIDPEFRDGFMRFCDPATITDRLRGKSRVTFEYHSRVSGWLHAHLLPLYDQRHVHITHMLFLTESVEEQHRQHANLSRAAHYDALTGLFNRQHGEEVIRAKVAEGGTQIFAILDCDNFKRINDQLSHLVGDKVLREQSRVLRQVFDGHSIMRLGGDEFVVHIGSHEAYRLINSFNGIKQLFDRLTQLMSEIRLPELENIAPTISCGVIFTDGSVSGLTFEEFYQYADEALRQSKQYRNGTVTISELRYRDYYH